MFSINKCDVIEYQREHNVSLLEAKNALYTERAYEALVSISADIAENGDNNILDIISTQNDILLYLLAEKQ